MTAKWCYEADFVATGANGFNACSDSIFTGGTQGAFVSGQGWAATARVFPPPVVAAQINRQNPASVFVTEIKVTVQGSNLGTQKYVALRLSGCHGTISQQQTMQNGTVDYTFSLNQSEGNFTIQIYNDASPSPAIYIRKVVFQGLGVNPFITNPSFPRLGASIWLYRAPITGNDSQTEVTTDPVVIDRYSVDPINNHLWLHTPAGWLRAAINGGATYIPDPQKPCGWLKVASSAASNRLIVPAPSVGAFTLTQAQIESCINNGVANASVDFALPPLAQVPWNFVSTVSGQLFTHFPMSLQRVCSGSSTKINGLGDPESKIIYGLPGGHPGVDVYGPVGSNIYSMGPGLVVGIGVGPTSGDFINRSSARWGSANVLENANNIGYSVIVRIGHLYVLYGHLKSVDPLIYVGKQVFQGIRLGDIGTSTNPGAVSHAHIEIRSFGSAIPAGTVLVKDLTGGNNDYGILANGGSQAINVYDIAQFFTSSVTTLTADGSGSIVFVTGLVKAIVNGNLVTFQTTTPPAPCASGSNPTRTYTTLTTTKTNGYRGFRIGQTSTNPVNPLTVTAAP
jgi:murein DD-endopeptidase MepM/ murein hydrolase activator NlpD